jgi:large subunit ribosomal protein L23
MKDPHDIILRPILTEQAYDGFESKNYTFQVALSANRVEIRKAIEDIFGVQVERVNTARKMGKLKRMGRTQGRQPQVKKAYVKLKESSKPIEFFEGMS